MFNSIIPDMRIIIRILWFALCFGVGNTIGNAIRDDYAGVEIAAITTTAIAALILSLEIIIYTRRRHDTSK